MVPRELGLLLFCGYVCSNQHARTIVPVLLVRIVMFVPYYYYYYYCGDCGARTSIYFVVAHSA